MLLELLRNDAQLWAEGDELRIRAAKGALTPSLREELSRHKREVVALLGQQARHALPSFAQQRLWFLDQLEPGIPTYNIPSAWWLTGQLNATALERSLDEIVRRHEALRTTFAVVDGSPVQVIAPASALTLPLIDLSELPQAEREAEVWRLAREEARCPFDLTRGPLLCTALLRLSKEEHVLVVGMHHIVSDGWSMGVFWRELGALYDAFASDRPSPLPELPIQYTDFAAWQRRWLQGEVLDEQLSYWKRQLAEVAALELPTDRPRLPVQSHRGACQELVLPEPLTKALRDLSRREGATLFMVLLAAFQALLSRYSGQEDVAVGSPIAGRNRAEIEGLIGFFVNTLVLRTDLSGDPTFRELLGRVREVALGAYAHQDLPFEKLVEDLKLDRDADRTPLFQVMFTLQNMTAPALELAGLTAEQLQIDNRTAKFDLTVYMREGREGLRGTVEYNTDLFEAATIDRMLGHFQTLLEGIVANLEQPISELPLLTEAERHQMLIEWNDTQTDYPCDWCVHELFEEQAERTPDAVAVVLENQHLTYRELNRRANRLAHVLRELGVGPEVPVGVCLERSPEMVVALLGVLKAGGAYVPLDPTYPAARLEFMLEDAAAPVLLFQEATRRTLPGRAIHTLCLDAYNARIERADADSPRSSGARPENVAYVIYTSGSTGKPKGVCVPHRAVGSLVMKADYAPLTSADVVAQASNSAFDAATWEIWGALLNGAQLVILSRDVTLSPRALAAEIERNGISALFLTTALFNQVARINPGAFRPLRHLLFGGEAVEPKLVRTLLAEGAPGRLVHVYGPTETTTFATWHLVEAVEDGAATIPIGHPIANTEAYVLDVRQRPVPIGVPGELYIGGPGVARGYLNRPELTEEKFTSHPFSDEPGARLYKTGDRVRRRANGDIEFLGRSDGQVKLRGFRIELGEIQSALNSHGDVRESVIVLREDIPEQKRLVAYVVPANPSAPSHDELCGFLRNRLPDYMVPSAFVVLEEFPLTANGKVDGGALPAPITTHPDSESGAPRDGLEKRLAKIWEEVLDVPVVGMEDDFFDLGGHSLLAVSLFARIEKTFDQQLPLATLFQAPTVRQLADILRRGGEEGLQASLVGVQPNGSRPPFFCVHGAGNEVLFLRPLAQHLGPNQPLYGFRRPEAKDKEQTVEDMAASYVRDLREFQPEGPYYLGGHSGGGIVALEMAQQLRRQGQEVALLALLDTSCPDLLQTIEERDKIKRDKIKRDKIKLEKKKVKLEKKKVKLEKQVKRKMRKPLLRKLRSRVRYHVRSLRDLGPLRHVLRVIERSTGVVAYKISLRFGFTVPLASSNTYVVEYLTKKQASESRTKAHESSRIEARESRIEARESRIEAHGSHIEARESRRRTRELFNASLRAYEARSYPGRVTLFRAAGNLAQANNPYLGWDSVAARGVEVYEVPGDHRSFIKEPHVKVLAAQLEICLDRAQANSS